ncbi:hypothetical protein [Thalassotalea ganghwensis]
MILAIILTITVYFLVNSYTKKQQGYKANKIVINAFCSIATFIIVVGVVKPNDPEEVTAVNNSAAEKTNSKTPIPRKEIMQLDEWLNLYQELETEIKYDSVFLDVGFGVSGQKNHHIWLEKVQNHILPLDVNPAWHATPSNLQSLALAYVRKDNEKIERLKRELDKVFNDPL